MRTPSDSTDAAARGGILAVAPSLDTTLRVVLTVLVAASALRYLDRHPWDPAAAGVLGAAVALVVLFLLRPARPRRRGRLEVWIGAVVVVWAVLTLIAPSFAWTAVPIAFAVLEIVVFPVAVVTLAAMSAVVSLGWWQLTDGLDPTVVLGPASVAVVTVLVARTLEREAVRRQRLLVELAAAQDDLAAAQHRSGVLAERARLSREIHDSVGQGLSSITLLLGAAERDWDRRPDHARAHVDSAAAAARAALVDVRHVVRDLAPTELSGAVVTGLSDVVGQVARQVAVGLEVDIRTHGQPVPIRSEVAGAVVRTVRGAVANAVEHARATTVVVSLTYEPGELLVDIRDDGVGFDPGAVRTDGLRGFGLRGIADRAAELGGRSVVESRPGDGTTLSLALPLGGRS